MANTVVTIDVEKVNQAGRKIIEEGNKMYSALEDIKDIINNTKKALQSDGGDAARTNFYTSAQKFEEFKKFVHEYGEFLESYAVAHKKIDDVVADLATKIPKL